MTMALTPGTRVRFTIGPLGSMPKDRATPGKFTARDYAEGETGTVSVPMPDDDWYAVTPDDDATVFVPVHTSMVEVIQ
jgi:hypothetical protein